MISSNATRSLAAAGALGLAALSAPAEASVFQASTTIPIAFDGPDIETPFSLPQYSGAGTIVGVNIALSGSAIGTDYYPYPADAGITVPPYSSTWFFDLAGPPDPSVSFLNVLKTAEYPGGSVPGCADTDPACAGPESEDFYVSSDLTAFSGAADVSDFADYAGSGSNAFILAVGGYRHGLAGSATVTETILTAVPEPSTWAMMVIGFAFVGFVARGRRVAKPLATRRSTSEAAY